MNRAELRRLRKAFAREANRFHDTSLTALYFTQGGFRNRRFRQPNHMMLLWQAYGTLDGPQAVDKLVHDIQASDIDRAGIRGSQYSCYALIEGREADLFVRMAARAGCIFSDEETATIQTYAKKDFNSNQRTGTNVFVTNRYSAAVWLNFVFFNLNLTHPMKFETRVDVDPFTASLAALDHLTESGSLVDMHRSSPSLDGLRFRVALSFPGEFRELVSSVARQLVAQLGKDTVFYDDYFKAQLARPNLDLLLQRIYHKKSDLIVAFLSSDYERKSWCGLEWRAIRDLIKQREEARLMIIRLDEAEIPGVFGIDGYLDASNLEPDEVAHHILCRLDSLRE